MKVFVMLQHLIIVVVISMMFPVFVTAQSLYVFIPTDVRANVIQKKIENFCSSVDVTVFGRAKDFHKQVKANPPDIILSSMPVVGQSSGFSVVLKGESNGLETEDYVLVSVDTDFDLASIAGKKIGAIDLLGRKPMQAFVSSLFKTKIGLIRVTKVEDLLPLISFGSVQALFISESLFKKIREQSNLDLNATQLDIKIGLIAAAVKNIENRNMTACITKFDSNLNSTLGVDKWNTQ